MSNPPTLWAIEALSGAAWDRGLVLKRTDECTPQENRRRVRAMLTTMYASDPELVWRGIEVVVTADGTEQVTVLQHNQ
ncbi:hypothetical protein ACPC54_18575 [Kitasatospora sp. NPDC094028]